MKLVLASRNPGKLIELRNILSAQGLEVLSEADVGVDLEVDETGTTFEENSVLKADAVMRASGMAAIADDSGLAVDALGGAPGIYSARYGGKTTDAARTELLLSNLRGVPTEARTARFVCVITCRFPGGKLIAARGECEGMIADRPMGSGGFGYDPVFYVPALGRTFAELTAGEKNAISHRGKALRLFAQKLNKECFHADK